MLRPRVGTSDLKVEPGREAEQSRVSRSNSQPFAKRLAGLVPPSRKIGSDRAHPKGASGPEVVSEPLRLVEARLGVQAEGGRLANSRGGESRVEPSARANAGVAEGVRDACSFGCALLRVSPSQLIDIDR